MRTCCCTGRELHPCRCWHVAFIHCVLGATHPVANIGRAHGHKQMAKRLQRTPRLLPSYDSPAKSSPPARLQQHGTPTCTTSSSAATARTQAASV